MTCCSYSYVAGSLIVGYSVPAVPPEAIHLVSGRLILVIISRLLECHSPVLDCSNNNKYDKNVSNHNYITTDMPPPPQKKKKKALLQQP